MLAQVVLKSDQLPAALCQGMALKFGEKLDRLSALQGSVTGHDFSHAAKAHLRTWALAPAKSRDIAQPQSASTRAAGTGQIFICSYSGSQKGGGFDPVAGLIMEPKVGLEPTTC